MLSGFITKTLMGFFMLELNTAMESTDALEEKLITKKIYNNNFFIIV
jgi:hypothetical protein